MIKYWVSPPAPKQLDNTTPKVTYIAKLDTKGATAIIEFYEAGSIQEQ